MINDYSFRDDLHGFQGHSRPRKPGVFVALGLVVFATAIYASVQAFDPTEDSNRQQRVVQTEEVIATTPEAKSVAEKPADSRYIPLVLPGQTEVAKNPSKQASDRKLPVVRVNLPTATAPAVVIEEKPVKTAELPPKSELESKPVIIEQVAAQPSTDIETPAQIAPKQIQQVIGHWEETKVKSGDTLSKIFSRLSLSANLLHRIVNSGPEAKKLAQIRPGERVRVRLDSENQLLELVHKRSPIESLQVIPEGESFTTRLIEKRLESRTTELSGIITESLYEGAKRAGLTDNLTMELANIFGWDIDFALEIRAGDQFSLVYEEAWLDGKKYRDGAILAAEFINRGKSYRAIRYEDDQGNSSYYSPDGHSMRKAFLRAPVDFRRISSRFTRARYHPVLGKKRPHRGVDYSAATGTPIRASGDGRVIFRGKKGGYGRTIIIQHGGKYTTLYAHLSKYTRKVKSGSRVKQGQTIGYVGKSGLATGPHLHYEFRVNGVHRNPLTIKLPAASPIAKKYRSDFQQKILPLMTQLDVMTKTQVAEAPQTTQ
ncbi:MAG: peptidoglycan DD-metalloendopeptidase family protein [Gammaproteobacteria bacterium]|nr:peptidoglycan DD-metalloendopeptidase family protein [Gammaproteobacteria bacterium]